MEWKAINIGNKNYSQNLCLQDRGDKRGLDPQVKQALRKQQKDS